MGYVNVENVILLTISEKSEVLPHHWGRLLTQVTGLRRANESGSTRFSCSVFVKGGKPSSLWSSVSFLQYPSFFQYFQIIYGVQPKDLIHSIQATHLHIQQEYCVVVKLLKKLVSISIVARLLPYRFSGDGTHQFRRKKMSN